MIILSTTRSVMVVGLDGATWDVLQYWMDRGDLPNIQELVKNGTRGILESVVPPVTAPAWKCYSTGKNPGKLGVYWWVNFDGEEGRLIPPSAYSFKSKDVWDYIGEEGIRTAIINMPTTYPPKPVNGVMVSGFGTPLEKDFDYDQPYTYPREKQHELEDKYGYEVGIPNPRGFQKKKLGRKVIELIHQRFNLAEDLVNSEDYGFINVTIFYINVLQHYFGKDEVVKKAWKTIDSRIGDLLREDMNFIIISDHGTTSIKKSIAINNWLIEKGYLKLKKDFGDNIKKMEDAAGRLFGLQGKCLFGTTLEVQYLLGRALGMILPDSLTRRWVGMMGNVPTQMLDLKIDWVNSLAVGLGQGPIYLNPEKVGDYEGFRKKIIEELKKIRDPETGEEIFEEVFEKETLYSGGHLNSAPDIVLLPKKGYEIYGGITRDVFHDKRIGWTTGNHPNGIFLAHGPDVRKGTEIEDARIIDVAPTILHMMGIRVPEDMDGKVLTEIFGEDSPPAKREVKYQKAEGERKRVEERIKKLKKSGKL